MSIPRACQRTEPGIPPDVTGETLKILRSAALFSGAVLAAVGLAVPASPAFAASPGCPSPNCVGDRVENTNCGPNNGAYAIASMDVLDPMHTETKVDYLWYSPLCNTFWGEDTNATVGYGRVMQLWGQNEYGGRESLLTSVSWINNEANPAFHETTMVSASGSVKYCIADDVNEDPDLHVDRAPSIKCTVWR
jgi:hypothetical protein